LQAVTDDRLALFAEMESKYEHKDIEYFVSLLEHPDYVVRTRATCILVDFGGEDKVQHVAKVLKNDENELVRHEAFKK
jgi:deoxyhypusine monooxygenase